MRRGEALAISFTTASAATPRCGICGGGFRAPFVPILSTGTETVAIVCPSCVSPTERATFDQLLRGVRT